MGNTEVRVSKLPKCNFCEKEARYDGKIRMGPWAYMCHHHFGLYGVGLGLGKGQYLIKEENNGQREIHKDWRHNHIPSK